VKEGIEAKDREKGCFPLILRMCGVGRLWRAKIGGRFADDEKAFLSIIHSMWISGLNLDLDR
jgi:hypothetical protein